MRIKYRIKVCELAKRDHSIAMRNYAHTYHYQGIICITPELHKLPLNLKYAILLHELGHLLSDGGDEITANNTIEEMFGIRIYYVDSILGDNLEFIENKNLDKAKKVLKRYIENL